jgi:hypothetical protein
MSSSNSGGKTQWDNVSSRRPCPICEKPDWCSITSCGRGVICRRVDYHPTYGKGKPRTDEMSTAYFYDLRPASERMDFCGLPEPKFVIGAERANPDTLNLVYKELFSRLPLDSNHLENLVARGLGAHPEVTNRFRTLGKLRVDAVTHLINHKDLERHFPGIPGLVIREKNGKHYWSVAGKGGLLIPVRDPEGRIIALNIRIDDVTGDGKYRWV